MIYLGAARCSDLRLDSPEVTRRLVEVGRVVAQLGVELRRVLALLLGPLDADDRLADVDRVDEARRDDDGLAEHRRAGADDEVGPDRRVDHLLDLAELAADRHDGHALDLRAISADLAAELPPVAA